MSDKEGERLARVETHLEWLVTTVSKMEPKIDSLIEEKWKRRGIQIAMTAIFTGLFEILITVLKN